MKFIIKEGRWAKAGLLLPTQDKGVDILEYLF